jgi:[ribosomal protein S5]-alanine N-acetyltransferase
MNLNESVFDAFPVLKTRRLVLREFRMEDAEAIFWLRNNPAVGRFIARQSSGLEQSKELVNKVIKGFENHESIGWAATLRSDDRFIGGCGLNRIEKENLRAEIGGELIPDYWGKAIAKEAVEAIVNFGLDIYKLHSIEARVMPENRGAVKILEELQFQKEAHLKDAIFFKDRFWDMAIYSRIK